MSDEERTLRGQFRPLLALAWPVILTNVAAMSLGVVDTLMVGSLGSQALAALALGHLWIVGTLMIGMGVVMGVDPLISQAHGRGDATAMGRALQKGLVIGLGAGVVVALIWLFTEDVLLLFGQDPALAALAHDYVIVQGWSAPLFLAFVALREHLSCRGIMGPALWATIAANFFNALFNWVLIFGRLGMPPLGVQGAGIATSLTRGVMLVGLALIVLRADLLRDAWTPWRRANLAPRALGEVLRHGVPIGMHFGFEIWAFAASTLIAGAIGGGSPHVLAAHSIVLQYASMTFMVPMGIAAAATTRVGNLLGKGRGHDAQAAAWTAFAVGAGAMACAGIVFLLLRERLAWPYSQDPAVLALAGTVFPVAAAFQVFDGIQVVGSGVLRGMGRTLVAAWAGLVGYWLVGLPLGWWLGVAREGGLVGVWWGIAAGLAAVGLSLLVFIRRRGPATMVEA